jgi:cytochrome c2
MQMKYLFVFIFVTVLISCAENKQPAVSNNTKNVDIVNDVKYEDGRSLFITNCSSCHSLQYELTGPALGNVQDRWENKNLLYEYIKNSKLVIAKDAYATALFNKYNKVEMTQFAWMTNKQIEQVLYYISVAGNKKD